MLFADRFHTMRIADRVHGGKRKASVWCLSVCLSRSSSATVAFRNFQSHVRGPTHSFSLISVTSFDEVFRLLLHRPIVNPVY